MSRTPKKTRAPKVTVTDARVSYAFTVKLSGQPARHFSGHSLEEFHRDLAAATAPAPPAPRRTR